MAHHDHEQAVVSHDPKHHITPISTYLGIFAALMVLTALTVLASLQNFGFLNTPIALGIATIKAALVIYFFMHARHATRLTWVVIVGSFLWVAVLFALTYSDYLSRGFKHL